eukprot:scaffold161537_cov17-Tisochrysis_lutea.AAC.1
MRVKRRVVDEECNLAILLRESQQGMLSLVKYGLLQSPFSSVCMSWDMCLGFLTAVFPVSFSAQGALHLSASIPET